MAGGRAVGGASALLAGEWRRFLACGTHMRVCMNEKPWATWMHTPVHMHACVRVCVHAPTSMCVHDMRTHAHGACVCVQATGEQLLLERLQDCEHLDLSYASTRALHCVALRCVVSRCIRACVHACVHTCARSCRMRSINDADMCAISTSLATNGDLRDLNLDTNHIGDAGAISLAKALSAQACLCCLCAYLHMCPKCAYARADIHTSTHV